MPNVEVERLISGQLADKWQEVISNEGSGQTAIVDVSSWLSRATLDAYVGESRTTLIMLTDPTLASGQGLLNMTLALWKTPTTNSQSHTRT